MFLAGESGENRDRTQPCRDGGYCFKKYLTVPLWKSRSRAAHSRTAGKAGPRATSCSRLIGNRRTVGNRHCYSLDLTAASWVTTSGSTFSEQNRFDWCKFKCNKVGGSVKLFLPTVQRGGWFIRGTVIYKAGLGVMLVKATILRSLIFLSSEVTLGQLRFTDDCLDPVSLVNVLLKTTKLPAVTLGSTFYEPTKPYGVPLELDLEHVFMYMHVFTHDLVVFALIPTSFLQLCQKCTGLWYSVFRQKVSKSFPCISFGSL